MTRLDEILAKILAALALPALAWLLNLESSMSAANQRAVDLERRILAIETQLLVSRDELRKTDRILSEMRVSIGFIREGLKK